MSAKEPACPGELLRQKIGCGTQEDFAKASGVSRFTVNQIINGKRGITADMALRIARVTRTEPEYWLRLQMDRDLYEARRKAGRKQAR